MAWNNQELSVLRYSSRYTEKKYGQCSASVLLLAMCTTVGGVASDSITWYVRREIDSWAIWHRVKNQFFNLFCKSNNNFYDNVFTVVANLRVCGFFLTVDRHPGTVQHILLVFCFVDVHTTTPPAPVDEYINTICHVLH